MKSEVPTISYADKSKFYRELHFELEGALDEHWWTNLSQFSALLFLHLPQINWVGFYLNSNEKLYLGPFQGKPACMQIDFGRGVCGTSAQTKKTIRVEDVELFDGHIACDSASRSEIVIPMIHQGHVFGVLDIDSPNVGRFDEADQLGLESLLQQLVLKTKWPEKF